MEAVLRRELEHRQCRAMDAAASAGAKALVLFATDGRGSNLRYLTNFAPIFGDAFLIVSRDRLVYLLNFNWEIPRARAASGIEEVIATFDLTGKATEVLRRLGIACEIVATIGFDRIPYQMHHALTRQNPDIEFVDITPAIERARRIKAAFEIAQLRRAVAVTDAALNAVRAALRPGLTERQVAALAEDTMKVHGASELAFPTCVVSGPDRAMPVGLPTDRHLQERDVVMVDVAAAWEGYQADLTRTYVVGRPTPQQEALWGIVTEAWQRVVEAIAPGVPCHRLHQIAQQVIESRGHRLVHRLGHGIGLHTSLEWPDLETEEEPLAPGMTFCIEPGLYIPGIGNFKIEDDVVVTQTGCEVLSHAERTLM